MVESGVQGVEKRRRIWLIRCYQALKQPKGRATMSKSTVVEFKDRETIIDPLSEMLKSGNFSKSPCIYDLMIQALPLITSGR